VRRQALDLAAKDEEDDQYLATAQVDRRASRKKKGEKRKRAEWPKLSVGKSKREEEMQRNEACPCDGLGEMKRQSETLQRTPGAGSFKPLSHFFFESLSLQEII
jgi:hypothetical protein